MKAEDICLLRIHSTKRREISTFWLIAKSPDTFCLDYAVGMVPML